ncbi:MAG: hypothetical protein Q9163_003315 [Psora crenata]
MASSGERIDPSKYSFQGRQPQAGDYAPDKDPTLGGLVDRTFNSCCPPDVQPNTRIIAVCGITDIITRQTVNTARANAPAPKSKGQLRQTISKSKDLFSASRRQQRKEVKEAQESHGLQQGSASPIHDGWFFSDFYLFYHLFRGAGANQLWLTCESPERLVEKYGEYLHGDANERRVVLDESMLAQIRHANNTRVFSREGLLEEFLRTLRSECHIAAQNHQPVLLLIFGHGYRETYGVGIGCRGGNPDRQRRFKTEHLRTILQGLNISVTLLMTSCYSGGWLYTPGLNISAATASGPRNETLSWPNSIGGRCHGSFWATAVTNAFIKFEDQRATQFHPYPSEEIDLEDERTSSTFAQLSRIIYETLFQEVDLSTCRHNIRFAAQDDAWEDEWRQRSGIPLMQFRERWNTLRQVSPPHPPAGPAQSRSARIEGTESSSDTTDSLAGHFGCKRSINRTQARNVVKDLCETYLNSFPGLDNAAPNRVPHMWAKQLVAGEALSDGQVHALHETMLYRMNATQLASEFRTVLGLPFVDCDKFDVEDWETRLLDKAKGKARLNENPKFNFYDTCLARILAAGIFPPPPSSEDLSFIKPERYLAVALTENTTSMDNVKRAITLAAQRKDYHVDTLTARVRNERTIRQVAREAFKSFGKRLRSPSPRKRGPIPSFDEVFIPGSTS